MNATIRVGVLAGVLALLVDSGCVFTSFHPAKSFEERNLPPVASSAVRVLRSPPNEAFLTLGEIVADISGFHSGQTVIRKVREKAATVGADAIIIGNKLFAEAPAPIEGLGSDSTPVTITFTAIRLLPEDPSHRHP